MKNRPYPLYPQPVITDLKDMIDRRMKKDLSEVAFTFSKGKKVISKTCAQFNDDINALGTFLYEKGFRNSHIAIIGENSYEWLVAFFAIANGGNAAVPIDKELSAEKVKQLLAQSDCEAVFVSKNYAVLVDNIEKTDIFLMSDYDEYISTGTALINKGNAEFLDYKIDADKLAAIFFTSGTTGNSKGVMLSHKNIASNIVSSCTNFKISGNVLALLPFNHTFALVTTIFVPFFMGCKTHLNKSLKNIQKDFITSKPDVMGVVPLFVETFYKMIYSTARKNGKYAKLKKAEKICSVLFKFGIDIRKKLFRSISETFGGNLEYLICGGALLDIKYIEAFRIWGINVINGYGITECSPVVSANRNHYWRDGSVGRIIDCCEVKISDDGEVLVKGDNVMLGYYKDESATKEVLHDGWYATGDLGYIDKDGFLFLTGRKKNLIILSNGENVSPEEIEAKIVLNDAVEEIVVYDHNGMLAAEIFPAEEYIGNQSYFDKLIADFNRNQPQYMQIQKVKLRDKGFEKNSTKKILRYKIMEEKND